MVHSVVVTPKLKDATSKQEQTQGGSGGMTFRQVFEKACEKSVKVEHKPQDISCYTTGYTRNAQSFIYEVERKEYC